MERKVPNRRIVVTGSRLWSSAQRVEEALRHELDEWGQFLLSVGDCPTGADKFALAWGRLWLKWPVSVYTAPWHQMRRAGGPIRNHFMIDMSQPVAGVLAFLRPESRGTVDCADYAEGKGIVVCRFYEGSADGVQEDRARPDLATVRGVTT